MRNQIKEFQNKLQASEGKEKFKLLIQLGFAHFDFAPDKSEEYAREALALAQELHLDSGIATSYRLLGISYHMQGNIETSQEFYKKSQEICIASNDKAGLAETLNNLAITYKDQGEYDKSLSYHLKSLKIREEIDHKEGMGMSYTNMAAIYRVRQDFDLALEYDSKALSVYKELDIKSGIATSYNNIGLSYSEQDKYPEAIEYFSKALEVREQIEDTYGKAIVYNNLGIVYKNQEDHENALIVYKKALHIFEEAGNKNHIAACLINIGGVEGKRGRFSNSFEYLERGIKLSKEIGAKLWLKNGYQSLAIIAKQKGDYKLAFEGLESFVEINDELFNEQKSKLIAEMQTRYDTEKAKKEAEIQHLRNVELANALEKLKATQKRLVESEKMASLGNLVAGIAHEVNTPVGIGITASSTLLDKTERFVEMYNHDDVSEDDLEGYIQSVYETNELILRNLQRTAELIKSFKKVSIDQSSEQKREFKLKDYLQDIIITLEPKLKGQNIQFDINCDDNLMLISYPGTFAQIFTNLILNSMIHGFNYIKSKRVIISVSLDESSNQIDIHYQDNGRGISSDNLPKIFDPFFSTSKQKGTGLGLHIVYNLVTQKLNGSIKCESNEGEGVLFIIKIPI